MSLHAPVHYAQEYTTLVEIKIQQGGSRLRGTVMEGGHVGKAAVAVEQVGPAQARKRTTRHADTPIIDTPGDKRWVFPVDYEWGDMIDRQDRVRMIIDPTGAYVVNGANALGESMDLELIGSFFATAKVGENGSTNKTFPSSQVVAVTTGAAAATGLNIAKLKKAKTILMAGNVDVQRERLYCGITALQHENLLNEIEATSKDFNSAPVLENGLITRFMGFDFIHTELFETDSNSYRRLPAWSQLGMHLGIWDAIEGQVYPRPDKSNNLQVLAQGTFGGTRTEEKRVVEIKCAES